MVEISLAGWRRIPHPAVTIWLKGHLYADGLRRILAAATSADELLAALPSLDGAFSLIAESDSYVLAAADRFATIPVFVAEVTAPVRWLVGGQASEVCRHAALSRIDADAALAIGLAGYTLGARALYESLHHLRAGEAVLLRADGRKQIVTYARYRPWHVNDRPPATQMQELADVLVTVFRKLVADAAGRPILVPLSAGYDSRLIAAALKQLSYPDIRCYAYGIPGNHEAVTSRRVAEHLGLPWRFFPVTPQLQRDFFGSGAFEEFTRFADTMTAVPFNQDYVATRELIDSGFAPRDAIIVNGQSGDYISGNHIPAVLAAPLRGEDTEARWQRLFAAACTKHFSLWQHLATPQNLSRMAQMFHDDLCASAEDLPADGSLDWALYEAFELIHRQSRYVIAGQRTYEHLGIDWRLPLWDRDLVAFFEHVPLSGKLNQALYRETLARLNWGGVFGTDIPVNRRTIRPLWLAPVRATAKAAAAALGRDAWHKLDRKLFAWHMDPLANYAAVPWSRVAADRRGFRNAISWHVEAYLGGHGIDLDKLADAS